MPTYQNTLNYSITVTDPLGGSIAFTALQSKTSYYILSDVRLTRTSDLPYYNPLRDTETITLTTATSASYTTDIDSRYVRITPRAGTPTVFINSYYNTPGIILLEPTTIVNRGKIEELCFSNPGVDTAIIDVKEIW